jgi:uncharacterized protein YndB with AHSA1/START domain
MIDLTKQFTIVREFDAPRETVWRAWTDENSVSAWWHPTGLITPRDSVSLDVRAGGQYRYTMVNGTDEYPTGGTYIEVDEPSRLVFTWGEPGTPVAESPEVTVLLEDLGGRTRMTFTLRGVDAHPGDGSFYDGWQSAIDELEAFVG